MTWVTEQAECENCGHEWIAVHEHAERLECPLCGFMTQATPTTTDPSDIN